MIPKCFHAKEKLTAGSGFPFSTTFSETAAKSFSSFHSTSVSVETRWKKFLSGPALAEATTSVPGEGQSG